MRIRRALAGTGLPLVAASIVAACGGGGSATDGGKTEAVQPALHKLAVGGAVQKGPFVVGTPVFVNRLDARGKATDSTVVTEVQDSIGSFSFEVSGPGPVQIISNGYYYSELTGQISAGSLTLKSIYEVSERDQQTAFVNILTHLTHDRILRLLQGGGQSVHAATAQAQNELVAALEPVLPTAAMSDFSALSIYNVNPRNRAGNGYLLALSTAFYKYGEIKAKRIEAEGGDTSPDAQLALILNVIAKDFAVDGLIQTEGFIAELTTALRSLNPQAVMKNLRERSRVDHSEPVEVPDISPYFGLCAGAADCAWSTRAPLPEDFALRGAQPVVHGGRIFVFGSRVVGGPLDDAVSVVAYDAGLNEWIRKPSAPGEGWIVGGARPFETDGRLLIAVTEYDGGRGRFIDSLYEFDDGAGAWTLFMHLPDAERGTLGAPSAAVDGKLFFVGSSEVRVLDLSDRSWTTAGPVPAGFGASHVSCRSGSEIHFFNDGPYGVTTHQTYDVSTHAWTSGAALAIARSLASCVSVGDRLFLMGGLGLDGQAHDDIHVHATGPDAWSEAPTRLPRPLAGFGAVAIGPRIFVMGGVPEGTAGSGGSTVSRAFNVLDTSRIRL